MFIELYVQRCVLLIVLILHHKVETSCNLGKYFSHPKLESLVCCNSSLWSGLEYCGFILLLVEELALNHFWKLDI